jgi:hypothetical protein
MEVWALTHWKWPKDLEELITWFYANQDKLPQQKFTLPEYDMPWARGQKGIDIDRPDHWYKILKADIGVGPHHYPTTSGMLLHRLKLLKDLVEIPRPRADVAINSKQKNSKKKFKERTEDELASRTFINYWENDNGQ